MHLSIGCFLAFILTACGGSSSSSGNIEQVEVIPEQPQSIELEFALGVDLSYVNQMEDCGVTYTQDSLIKDPYLIMADSGANLVRVRLWHNPLAHPPFPNSYSSLADVEESIRRSKEAGMQVLLDFHYSDQWADPGKQWIPDAWKDLAGDTAALQVEMFNYSRDVIEHLKSKDLMPEYVQIGNETNGNILVPYEQNPSLYPTDFIRQASLLQAGIDGVQKGSEGSGISPQIILHVAGPQHLRWWASNINAQSIDYDILGVSYYSIWSDYTIDQVGVLVSDLMSEYGRPVMVVETAVPWTLSNNGDMRNIQSSMPTGYMPASSENQKQWLIDLRSTLIDAGAAGMIYWEPAWVTTACETQWGVGSSWENAGFFDFNNDLIEEGGIQFLSIQ